MAGPDDQDWEARFAASLARDDAQEFEQVRNLGGFMTKVWHRPLGCDFMAETKVQRKDRMIRLTASGEGRAECLENLAAFVAEYLYPPDGVKIDRRIRHRAHEGGLP